MVKDIRYIIKRVIAAILIALILMFIKSHNVYAKEMTSTNWTYQYQGINTNSSAAQFTITGNPWANWRLGKLYFTVAVNKTAGSSTDPVLNVRAIHARSDTSVYTCTFGAVSNGNSTWQSQTYSVICPMDLGWPGVTGVDVLFNPIPQQTYSGYVVTLDGVATFEQDDSVTVNVDTSSTTSAINNQITNDNTNTTNIINNQNQNTQQQIESQKVCTKIDKSSISINNATLVMDGSLLTSGWGNYGVSDYYSLNQAELNLLVSFSSSSSSTASCFYNINKTLISCTKNVDFSLGTITVPSGASFVRFSINKVLNEPQFSICQNGNQAIAEGQQQINDTLNDDTGVSNSELSDLFGDLESSDTPISDLLTMPITLLNAYIDGFEGTCQRISLGSLYGENIILPCINLEDYLGSTLFGMIDVLICIYLIYNLSQLFITAFDDLTSLKDNFDWLYGVEGGRHAAATRSQRWE